MTKRRNGSSGSGGRGNSRISPSRWFCFTFFSYDPSDIIRFQGIPGKYVFQEEICPRTQRPHLQGTVCFDTKKRLVTVNNEWPNTHWEVCRGKKASVKYCAKAYTRKPGSKMFTNMKMAEPLITFSKLRPWQQEILDKAEHDIAVCDDRTINWFWEPTGNVGKSSFGRWLAIKKEAFYLCGSAADMKCGLADASAKMNGWFPKIIVLDIPRDSNGCSYKGIEQIKNGIFYSTKYESGMCIFNPPAIIVLANEPPRRHKMSEDRWNIVKLDLNEDLVIDTNTPIAPEQSPGSRQASNESDSD